MSTLMVPFNFQPVSTDVVNGSAGGSSFTIPAGKYANIVCSAMGGGYIQLTPSGGSAKTILRSKAAEAPYDNNLSTSATYPTTNFTGSALNYVTNSFHQNYVGTFYQNYLFTTGGNTMQQSDGDAFTFSTNTHKYNAQTKTSGHPGTASTISIWVASNDSINVYASAGQEADIVISLYNNQS